jgi:hypothetical protein
VTEGGPGVPTPERRRALAVTAAALLGGWALLFAPALLSSDQFLYRDAGRMFHPVKRWIAGELHRGHLPEWNPYEGLGLPLVACAVDAPLHPFNVLPALLPFEAGFKAWVLLSVLAAGFGAAAWARRLGLGTPGATAAGLAFMLSGFVVSSTDNLAYLTTLAGAPWLLAAAHAAATGFGPWRLAAVALASFATAAGGDPMGWGVAVGLALLQPLILVSGAPLRRRALRASAAAAVALLGAAPVILPIVAWLPSSSRGADVVAGDQLRWNLHPARLLELLVPHLTRSRPGAMYSGVYHLHFGNEYTTLPWVASLYLGATVLALVAFAATRERRARWLVIGAALFLWMAMGLYAGFGQLARHLPLLSSLRFWEKLAAWPTLLLAVAAGAGVDALLAAPATGRRLAAGAGLLGLLLLAGAGMVLAGFDPLVALVQVTDHRRAAQVLLHNAVEGAAAAGLALGLLALVAWSLARGRLGRLAPLALLLCLSLDVGAASLRAYLLMPVGLVTEPAPLFEGLEPRRQDGTGLVRIATPDGARADRWPDLLQVESAWRWAARTAAEAMNVGRRIGNVEAYTGLLPRRLLAVRDGSPETRLTGPSALWGVDLLVLSPTLDRAARFGLAPPYALVAEDPALPAVLVRRPARPRVTLAGALESVDEAGALAFALRPDATSSGRSVVEGRLPDGYAPPQGAARLVVDEGERVVVEATSDRAALLILADQVAPGWTATVDGAPAAILPANYLGRGVWLGPGSHRVQFDYRTPLLREGLWLAALLWLGLGAWATMQRVHKRHLAACGPMRDGPSPTT